MNYEEQQKKALGELWRVFGFNKSRMAKELGVSKQTVQNWFARGRISATQAILASEHPLVSTSKESMRPDVKEWFGV